MEIQEDILENVPSDEVSEVGKVDISTDEYTQMVEHAIYTNQQLSTLVNISIVTMVGIAILVGILASSIYSRYFKS